MSYKTILLSKLLETDLLFDNMGPVAQRLEQGTVNPFASVSLSRYNLLLVKAFYIFFGNNQINISYA